MASCNKNDVEMHKGANDDSGSSKRSELTQVEVDSSEGDISTEKNSSSSSSSGSSTDEQSQLDTKQSPGTTSGNCPSTLKQYGKGSAGSTSKPQVSGVAPRSTLTQSPPMQVMDRQVGEFDPNRIPCFVFSSKSTTPMEWSLTSNESLFSIRVESAVFYRDPYKQSQEFSKRYESKASTPSPVAAPRANTKISKFDKTDETVVSDDVVKDKGVLAAEEPIAEQPKLPIVSWKPDTSNHSSENAAREFLSDIPVKNKKWCASCSGCSWAFCYCSNYSFALCYCWNCSMKRWFCDCCSNSEDETNVPEKEEAQQKQKSKSLCSKCCCLCCCSSDDETNDPQQEKALQKHKQQEKPLAAALESNSSCSNCCTCFLSWCCCCSCFRGKCLC